MSTQRELSSRTTDNKRSTWGNRLFRFSAIAIMLSSLAKFLHPPKAVAYMASMGYEGSTLFLIAAMEMAIAILCLMPATRRVGLLLISAFLGGAVAAHVANHRLFSGGPFITYMAQHPYVGALIPGALLAMAWVGDYLQRTAVLLDQPADQREIPQATFRNIAVGSNALTS